MKRILGCLYIFYAMCAFGGDFIPQIECGDPHRFSKAQRENIIYAYTFGAPKGLGYTLAAIAWQESCGGAYMLNFSDPSAGLYHAHIPIVIKNYFNSKDSSFNRNVVGQILINDITFSSKVALDMILYWYKYHKGNYKNTIKSYNKGFKWQKDPISDRLAESYYTSIIAKISALEAYIPRYSRVKNQSLSIELEDKNQQIKRTFRALQNARSPQINPQNQKEIISKPQITNGTIKTINPKNQQNPHSNNFDDRFEDFDFIYEGKR